MVRAIELGCEFARYSPVARLWQELQYARMSTRAVVAARPDVAVLSKIPLLSLFILTLSLRLRRVPYVFWQQDVYSEAIRVVACDRLGRLPVNVGSSELVSINEIVCIIEQIAGITVERNYNLDAPKGVRGRNSDNTLINEIYDWEPSISLADGLERIYRWIFDQLVGSWSTGDRTPHGLSQFERLFRCDHFSCRGSVLFPADRPGDQDVVGSDLEQLSSLLNQAASRAALHV
jgi:hypothetical protein